VDVGEADLRGGWNAARDGSASLGFFGDPVLSCGAGRSVKQANNEECLGKYYTLL